MTVPIILLVGLLLCYLWVTIRQLEAWPFSYYPMFSKSITLNDVEVFRVALETKDNETIWWKSHFFRYPEIVGEYLQKLHYANPKAGNAIAIVMQRDRILEEVLRLIVIEEGSIDQYKAFRIVRRTASWQGSDLEIEDRIIGRIPMTEAQRSRLAN